MKTIFVDFEMNGIQTKFKETRSICKNEIIEIGAVLLDEEFHEISSYCQHVKPEFNEITDKYSRLTGITNRQVQSAPHFEAAILEFLYWCENQCKGDGFIIYSWSDSDLTQLQKEIKLKNIEAEVFSDLTDNWRDFQREFCDILGLEKIISLEAAIGSIGEKFDGKMHDAIWDARNTAKIFSITKDIEKFNQTMKPIIDALKPSEPMTYCLGDVFRFDCFSVA